MFWEDTFAEAFILPKECDLFNYTNQINKTVLIGNQKLRLKMAQCNDAEIQNTNTMYNCNCNLKLYEIRNIRF